MDLGRIGQYNAWISKPNSRQYLGYPKFCLTTCGVDFGMVQVI